MLYSRPLPRRPKPPFGKAEMISKQEYQAQAAQGYNRIPLVQELLADLDTPLSLYLKLANRPYTYLLESVVGGERFGRYSFIGLPCSHYLKAGGKHVDVYQNGEIEAFHNRFKTPEIPNLPRFTGGLVGYFGYETIYNFEHFAHRLKNTTKADPLGTPDILLMLSQELAVVDNLSGKIYLIVYADPSQANGYERARERLEDIRTQLRQSCAIPLSLGSKHTEAVSEFGEEPFKACVNKIKDYIFAGDCMQVVPSQRMSIHRQPARPLPRPAHAQPFALPLLLRFRRFPYCRLFARNPRPPRTRRRYRPPHRRHAPARQNPRRRPCQRTRFVKRRQRNRRTRHAYRFRAQRCRPHQQNRRSQSNRQNGD